MNAHDDMPQGLTRLEQRMWRGGGWCEPPGRLECARRRAADYLAAESDGWTWDTRPDEWPDLSWMDDDEHASVSEVLIVFVVDPAGNVAASVGGVVDPDDDYLLATAADLYRESRP